MKKGFLRIVAGAMAIMMVLACVGSAVPAYASDGATKQEKVLTVTQDMVNAKGTLTVSGEWDRIVVPKEISASYIYFRDVKVSNVEIESGNNSRIELISGEVGNISIVPAKLTVMTVQDLRVLIKEMGDVVAAFKLYEEVNNQNGRYLNQRPTLITRKDVVVEEMTVSGNAKLNLGNGSIENVKVDSDGTQKELKVDISDYTGNVSVKQEESKDGKWMIARVKLKNSSVESLVMEGDGNGSIILDGQKSEVKEVKVESAAFITLDVPAEKVEVPESTKEVRLTILDKVEEMQISAAGTTVEVGSSGTVTNATVEGNDVTISGKGDVADVEITGSGAAVSTPGTNVEGENTYVPPTVITPPADPVVPPAGGESGVRDLGGLQIIVGDHWSPNFPVEPTNPEEEALQAYREEMMKKHNFTIKQVGVADWGGMIDTYRSSILLGNPVAQVFVLDYRFIEGNRHLFYDLSKLSELDFTEEKWADSVTEQMKFGDGIYGMAVGPEEPRGGILFNKRLFEEAGLDPELPYELQASGEWTWSKYMELCELLTRDVNGDGITDVYGQVSQDLQTITQLVISTGNDFITMEDGKYVNNLASEDVKEALAFAKEVINSEYSMQQPENSSWDWFMPAFAAGVAAMQFNEVYMTQPGQYYGEMEDELGFVCCPKPDWENSYHTGFYENIAVIPACYDEQTAADIAFAYNIWTNPAPGYENGTDWKEEYAENNLDERAFDETFEIFRQEGVGHAPQMYLLEDSNFFSQDLFWSWPYDNRSVDEVIATIKPEWDALVTEVNAKTKINVVAPRPDGSSSNPLDSMYTFSVNDDGNIIITGYKDMDVTELIIPDDIFGHAITEIDEHSFSGYVELESVVLPNRLNKIGRWAFASCENLENVVIPDGVTEIGEYAFAYNTGLERVTIPASVTSIGAEAFGLSWDCAIVLVVEKDSYAESYAKENGIAYEYVGEDDVKTDEFLYVETANGTIAIVGYKTLASNKVDIPMEIESKPVTAVSGGAFAGCATITCVHVSESVTEIGPEAFSGCDNLAEVVIPASVVTIGEKAFDNSHNITITTVEGSCADTYAKANGISVQYVDALTVEITEVGIHNSYYKEYPDPDGTGATCLIQLEKGISGKFSYSRELTQSELNDWWHSGILYDAEGNRLETGADFRWWAISSGDFAAQLPAGLKAGNYIYELLLTINGKSYSLKSPFTLTEDIMTSESV